jgi:hypothetical protein
MLKAPNKLLKESFLIIESGTILPVNMIGFDKFSKKKLKKLAV